jgi:hypothetical protein
MYIQKLMLTSLIRRSSPAVIGALRKVGGGALSKGHDLLQDDHDSTRTSVGAMGDKCFSVNNVIVRQSVILLPNSFLLWSPKNFTDINCDSLVRGLSFQNHCNSVSTRQSRTLQRFIFV